MTSNAASSSNWKLYVILDRGAAEGRDLATLAAAALQGGADALQLRDKLSGDRDLLTMAQRLLPLAKARGVPLIINDRPDIALAAHADGVHLGQDDLPPDAVRQLVGPQRLIGVSTHSLEQAIAAQRQGADYLGFGPIFSTPTKPDYPAVGLNLLAQAHAQIRLPIVSIGGIDTETLPRVLQAGGRRIAVVRAVCAALDPEASARALKRQLEQFHRQTNTA